MEAKGAGYDAGSRVKRDFMAEFIRVNQENHNPAAFDFLICSFHSRWRNASLHLQIRSRAFSGLIERQTADAAPPIKTQLTATVCIIYDQRCRQALLVCGCVL